MKFNGEPIGEVIAAIDRTAVSVRIPRDAWNRQPVGTLELDFPQAQAHRIKFRPDYEWWTAWTLWGIRFEAASGPGHP